MEKHVNAVCRSCYHFLRGIARIRPCLDQTTAETLIHSMVYSRLDYCNSLFSGISKYLVQRLQRVQNFAARVVCKIKFDAHVTPYLRQLHWLPVCKRIQFKVLLLVFKVMNGMAPQYLCDLLVPYLPTRQLRSSDKKLLKVPATRLKTFGDRAFTSIGPRMWNALPIDLRNVTSMEVFKKKLKTHLFIEYFS